MAFQPLDERFHLMDRGLAGLKAVGRGLRHVGRSTPRSGGASWPAPSWRVPRSRPLPLVATALLGLGLALQFPAGAVVIAGGVVAAGGAALVGAELGRRHPAFRALAQARANYAAVKEAPRRSTTSARFPRGPQAPVAT